MDHVPQYVLTTRTDFCLRLARDQRSQAFRDRKISEGKSRMDALRCLKRYIAREIYYALKTDLTRP